MLTVFAFDRKFCLTTFSFCKGRVMSTEVIPTYFCNVCSKRTNTFTKQEDFFSKPEELFTYRKDIFKKCNDPFANCKDIFTKCKDPFTNCKDIFIKCKEAFSNRKEAFLIWFRSLGNGLVSIQKLNIPCNINQSKINKTFN
jgi:hypothetical protein